MITGKNQIGQRLSANGDVVFNSFDSTTNQPNEWQFIEATEEEVEEAVRVATKAFSAYRNTSSDARRNLLDTIAEGLNAEKEKLLDVYCKESGLSKSRATAELGRTIFQLQSYGAFGASKEFNLPKEDDVNGITLRKIQVPLGPVAVFGSSNFPFAYSTAGGDTASALAAGCPVIVKGHPLHPGTGELVAQIIASAVFECGLPEGVFSNLNAQNYRVGEQLVLHPGIKAVGFTGSIAGGRALFNLASNRKEPIPVFAEMGSINPVVFSERELKENRSVWVEKLSKSMLDGAGQFCTNPGLIIALKSNALELFLEELSEVLLQQEPQCMLGEKMHHSFHELRKKQMKTNGVITLMDQQEGIGNNCATATLVKVSGAQFLNQPSLHEEVFGPFSVVVECGSVEELIKIIESLEGQLTGTLNCSEEEVQFARAVINSLSMKVGRIIFQGVPTGVAVSESMHHGGPYPASTDSRFTAVGGHAIYRWVRPLCLQNVPDSFII
jgi:NADP-dependent aldehyde dehydrogenase